AGEHVESSTAESWEIDACSGIGFEPGANGALSKRHARERKQPLGISAHNSIAARDQSIGGGQAIEELDSTGDRGASIERDGDIGFQSGASQNAASVACAQPIERNGSNVVGASWEIGRQPKPSGVRDRTGNDAGETPLLIEVSYEHAGSSVRRNGVWLKHPAAKCGELGIT